MKNIISYYYGLMISEFRKKDESFYFSIDNIKYEFVVYYGNIDKLYKIYSLLIGSNKYCHEIIINTKNSIITFYDNKPYLLLKKNFYSNNIIKIIDIINYDILIYGSYELNWKELWKDKIDYYEYQITQYGLKYKKIKESLSYYIGLSECAINLLNYVKKDKLKYFISHNRIKYNETMDEFLNPTNIIIDSRVRDISEYFKSNYINDNIEIDEVIDFLDRSNFDYTESLLFLSRLIYPSYYFDVYDKIIQEKISEEKIDFITKKNTHYEVFLKKIYIYLKNKYKIPEVEWLEY